MNGAQTSDMSSSAGPHLYLVTLPEPVRGKHLRNASMKRDPTAVSKGICNSRHCYTFSYSKTLAWNTQMCYCEKIMVKPFLFYLFFLQIVKLCFDGHNLQRQCIIIIIIASFFFEFTKATQCSF